MPDYINRLESIIERASLELVAISDSRASIKPAPGKWSPKEILGHLIDSTLINHQRFIRAQFQDHLVFEGYDQDAWVSAQRYNEVPWSELVELWASLNRHLARGMVSTPEPVRQRKVKKHNLHQIALKAVPAGVPTTLDYLMADYVDHVEHHLRQILGADWLR